MELGKLRQQGFTMHFNEKNNCLERVLLRSTGWLLFTACYVALDDAVRQSDLLVWRRDFPGQFPAAASDVSLHKVKVGKSSGRQFSRQPKTGKMNKTLVGLRSRASMLKVNGKTLLKSSMMLANAPHSG